MKFYADVHLHSYHSRATSKQLNLEHLHKWAQLKGITVVGTGDFVHPAWLDELKEKLEPSETGLFKLKEEYARTTQLEVPKACHGEVRFMLSVEISSIYKRGDKVRKIHNVVFVPSFEAAQKLQSKLDAIGNIRSDGRPILGLDSRDLLEIVLATDPLSFLVPAHIWTPWFAVLGSKGGFDSIEECFDDLTPHIFAVETGLSSDPPMNWRLSQLDDYVLISNSDAHSPPKLAREANVFATDLSYPAIRRAWEDENDKGFLGTIEFFPEEGKYHYDGHRNCKMRLHPRESAEHQGNCPVCGKPVTVGVMARVEKLADRDPGSKSRRWRPFTNLIPLPEIISEIKGKGPATKTVARAFDSLLKNLGNELYILQEAPFEDIERMGGLPLAEAIRRMRAGEVNIAAGYDGEFGVIRIFTPKELKDLQKQSTLVDDFLPKESKSAKGETSGSTPARVSKTRTATTKKESKKNFALAEQRESDVTAEVNPSQLQAIEHRGAHLLIVAGPGTGKTHTMTQRIAHLVQSGEAASAFLAITFTNKAASELRDRLMRRMPDRAPEMTIGTFHSFCLTVLREFAPDASQFRVITDAEKLEVAEAIWPESTVQQRKSWLAEISDLKSGVREAASEEQRSRLEALKKAYCERGLWDFDDLLQEAVALISTDQDTKSALHDRYRWIFVDEYQDINAVQHSLLELLVHDQALITAIGDPNQAIYGFRGSDTRFFTQFSRDFPGAAELRLEKNYRSGANIISASGQVIEKADESIALPLSPALLSDGRVTIYAAPTDKAEAEYVVHQIEKMVGGTSMFSQDSGRVERQSDGERTFRDVAVLFRLKAMMAPLAEAFERSGMPYQTPEEVPLVDKKGVSPLLACLSLAAGLPANPRQLAEMMALLLPGFGPAAVNLTTSHFSQLESLTIESLRSLPQSVPIKSGASPYLAVVDSLQLLQDKLQEDGLSHALESFLASPPVDSKLSDDAGLERNWMRIVSLARQFESPRALLDRIHLRRNLDEMDSRAERVTLMTLHAAKGLEFPVVFITGCEQGLLPLDLDSMRGDPAEERRLFYVGMTRAKDHLYLVRSKKRMLFGRSRQLASSIFLSDIEEKLKAYEYWQARQSGPKKAADKQLKLF